MNIPLKKPDLKQVGVYTTKSCSIYVQRTMTYFFLKLDHFFSKLWSSVENKAAVHYVASFVKILPVH